LFVEGTEYERGEIDGNAPRRPAAPLERHPLVVHYGLPIEALALTKAHRSVEGHHRRAAWTIVLDYVGAAARPGVVDAMESVLVAWHAYRDEVAEASGLERP
jgi:pyrroloquinoline-quinone synthase